MTKPRIAVCGAGLVGARHVAEAANQAQLAAVIDPSDAAKDLALSYDVPWFDDLEQALSSTEMDGVVIATPNHLHADHAVACLQASLPVLIEKPIADTLENAARIVSAQRETGVPVLIGHHRRHNLIVKAAKTIIDSGDLGDIVAVHGQFWLYKPDDYFDADWRTKHGAGPLLINCIHDIDLLRHLCGEVVELTAMGSTNQRGFEVEDTLAILMRFENGALGTFSVSDTIVSPWSWELTSGENPIYPETSESCYHIGGTHGGLSIPDMTVWTHVGQRSWWSEITSRNEAPVPQDAFAAQFTHFLDMIEGARSLVSAKEGMASLEVVLKALERTT